MCSPFGPFLDSIYRRTAQLLKIDQALLKGHGRIEGVVNAAEPLQIVNYQVGQKYDYHYDWKQRWPMPIFRSVQ